MNAQQMRLVDVKKVDPRQALRIMCPRCGAPPREACTTAAGEPAATTHRARRRHSSFKAVS